MKNILLVSLDCLRSDALGVSEDKFNPPINSNTMNRLASKGVLFPNTIVQAPYTIASHASMLTGLYPFNHGLRRQFNPTKLNLGSLRLLKQLKKNYDLYSFVGADFFDEKFGYDVWDHQEETNLWTIKKYLRKNHARPFFSFVHYWGIHTPYQLNLAENLWEQLGEHLERIVKNDYLHVPKLGGLHKKVFGGDRKKVSKIRAIMKSGEEVDLRKIRQGYQKGVERADYFIKKLINILEDQGIRDSTTIVITGDHGESFNEYNEIESFPEDYEHGPFLYDNVIKVPLIIIDPDLPSGRIIDQQVQSIDILPTIFDVMGFEIAQQVNGRSLLPFIYSKQSEKDYSYAYSETKKDSKGNSESKVDKSSLRSSRGYKLIADRKQGTDKLVDYRNDEREDVKEKRNEEYEKLKKALDNLFKNEKNDFASKAEELTEREQREISERLKSLGYLK